MRRHGGARPGHRAGTCQIWRRIWPYSVALQVIRHQLATFATELSAAKTLLYHSAAKKDRGESVRLEASMKAHIPELLKRLADACMQIHGASGYMRGIEIERIFRDARPTLWTVALQPSCSTRSPSCSNSLSGIRMTTSI